MKVVTINLIIFALLFWNLVSTYSDTWALLKQMRADIENSSEEKGNSLKPQTTTTSSTKQSEIKQIYSTVSSPIKLTRSKTFVDKKIKHTMKNAIPKQTLLNQILPTTGKLEPFHTVNKSIIQNLSSSHHHQGDNVFF